MSEMTAEQLEEKMNAGETLHIVDVRELDEVANGMVPGAINIPLSEFADRYTELEKEKEYILICAAGGRSAKAQMFLEAQDRKSTRLNSSHVSISYAVFCLKTK